MPKNKISAVIITKNEEDNIARCLDSLKWVDEIIVVDGESEDRTPEIARSYGAKIITHVFEGDFGLERNIGNKNASGEWILALDADEVIPQKTRLKIEEILKNGTDADAYNVLRKQFFLGKFMEHGGGYHRIINFFKKDKTHFDGKVHHLVKVDGKILDADFCIEHYPFNSISQFIMKHNRYTDCEAKEMFENFGPEKYGEVKYNLSLKPIKLFFKTYIKKKGYKDGLHGLVFCLLFAWSHILKWSKYWELCEKIEIQRKD